MGERAEYSEVSGRVKFAFTLPALIDLLAIVPVFFGSFGSDSFLLRLLRLARILTLAKLGPFTTALVNLKKALASRSFELLVSITITLGVLLLSAIILYIVEKDGQPEAFGSIPRAMWWAVATLTTVGYGDVYPVTPLGKIFAGISALSSLGLVAMPAGILAGAFGEAFQKNKNGAEPE